MALLTADQLIDALRHHRILEAGKLETLVKQQREKPVEPRALAQQLIQSGWLTPYQVNQLLTGRAKELQLGSYILLERLGEGGMGQVFKARNWRLGKIVALKLMRKERLANSGAIQRFQREIKAAGQLDHPHIVRAFDAGEIDGNHIFAMEYVEGIDLAKLVKTSGPLPVAVACEYIRQAARGLQHAHEKGLVHRDIKPHNLIVEGHGPQSVGLVKILDMGLARLQENDDELSTLTQEGSVMGTLDYMSPEQARNAKTVDIRSDLYSLGCTFYYLLTGQVPFAGGTAAEKMFKHQFDDPEPVTKLRPEVPPGVAAILQKLLAKRPEDRFQTPGELDQALGEVLAQGGRVLPGLGPVRPPPRPPGSFDTSLSGSVTLVLTRFQMLPPKTRWLVLGGAAAGGLLMLALFVVLLVSAAHALSGGKPTDFEPTQLKQGDTLVTRKHRIRLKPVPAGKFKMGSPRTDPDAQPAEAQHEVEITHPFHISVTEVTVGQFKAFVKATGYKTEAETNNKGAFRFFANPVTNLPQQGPSLSCFWLDPFLGKLSQTDDHPVVCVSWNDAMAFCEWLSKEEGKKFTLPTEAQWEFACRAGTSTRYSCGDDQVLLEKAANVADAAFKNEFSFARWPMPWNDGYAYTAPVSKFQANPLGLDDMHGNVAEWCLDWYSPTYYNSSPVKDPTGPTSGTWKVIRGGSWKDNLTCCRSAARCGSGFWKPNEAANDVGFRIVLLP